MLSDLSIIQNGLHTNNIYFFKNINLQSLYQKRLEIEQKGRDVVITYIVNDDSITFLNISYLVQNIGNFKKKWKI